MNSVPEIKLCSKTHQLQFPVSHSSKEFLREPFVKWLKCVVSAHSCGAKTALTHDKKSRRKKKDPAEFSQWQNEIKALLHGSNWLCAKASINPQD